MEQEEEIDRMQLASRRYSTAAPTQRGLKARINSNAKRNSESASELPIHERLHSEHNERESRKRELSETYYRSQQALANRSQSKNVQSALKPGGRSSSIHDDTFSSLHKKLDADTL